MEEIDIMAAQPKPLVGWSPKADARGGLVIYLEYTEPFDGLDCLTLAIPLRRESQRGRRARSAPTAKLRLAALKHLFDWMVTGQIMSTNPAAAVRGPRHIVRRGKTPVLDPAEARQLLDAIDTTTIITGSRPSIFLKCDPPILESRHSVDERRQLPYIETYRDQAAGSAGFRSLPTGAYVNRQLRVFDHR